MTGLKGVVNIWKHSEDERGHDQGQSDPGHRGGGDSEGGEGGGGGGQPQAHLLALRRACPE